MKLSLSVALLFLAVGSVVGWRDRQQFAVIQTAQKQLAAEAAQLGISPDAAQNPTRPTKRERPTRSAVAKLSTAELIALGQPYQQLPLLEGLSALDSAELAALLTEITTSPNLDDQTRIRLAFDCISVLATDHPQAALEIFANSSELSTKTYHGRILVLTALSRLAKTNLTAVLDWVKNHPQHFAEEAKGAIITAIAQEDARHAFRLITDLDFKISDYAVRQLLVSQTTLEAKSAALAGLREYLASLPEGTPRDQLAESALESLGYGIANEDLATAMRWISEEKFTPQELRPVISGLSISTSNGQTGQWIEWLRQTPPEKTTQYRIEVTLTNWITSDYQAALQWAMTQPPGKDRSQVFRHIYQGWPESDPAGKEAFKQAHGVE